MNAQFGPLRHVLRLTRSGRLTEATALIRQGLTRQGFDSAHAASGFDATPSRSAASPFSIDLVAQPSGAYGMEPAPRVAPDGVNHKTVPDAATWPRPAQFDWRVVKNDQGGRRYKLYVPTRVDDAPLPLIVMLHGCTQSPDDFAAGTRMNALADEMGFLVAYPEQPKSANISKCWNWFQPGDQRRDSGEPSLIAAITREIMSDFSVVSGKVYVAGLSAGGAAAAIMGQAYPELYAGVGVHSGLACGMARDVPSAFAAMRTGSTAGRGSIDRGVRVPTIIFQGTADKTVNPVNASHVLDQAAHGFSKPEKVQGRSDGGMAYVREVYRDGSGATVAEVWMLERAGHAWSGGSADGSYTDPRGPDASREMMRFFSGLASG